MTKLGYTAFAVSGLPAYLHCAILLCLQAALLTLPAVCHMPGLRPTILQTALRILAVFSGIAIC